MTNSTGANNGTGSPASGATGRPVLAAAVVMAALAGALLLHASAQDPPPAPASLPEEYTVKAVFLYSFGRFVQWPPQTFANDSEPFVIAVAGEDSFGRAPDEIAAKKTIQDRHIVIHRFAAPDDYRGPCQILFVSRSLGAEAQAAILKKTAGKPVFVVGETPGFCQQGGIANFYVAEDRIRFEINADAARHAQLRLDAQLLNLGKAVVAPPPATSHEAAPSNQ